MAKITCKHSGQKVENHFVDVNEMVEIGSKTERNIGDIELSRYVGYLNTIARG
jgi:DNA-damage-inducible protein D